MDSGPGAGRGSKPGSPTFLAIPEPSDYRQERVRMHHLHPSWCLRKKKKPQTATSILLLSFINDDCKTVSGWAKHFIQIKLMFGFSWLFLLVKITKKNVTLNASNLFFRGKNKFRKAHTAENQSSWTEMTPLHGGKNTPVGQKWPQTSKQDMENERSRQFSNSHKNEVPILQWMIVQPYMSLQSKLGGGRGQR